MSVPDDRTLSVDANPAATHSHADPATVSGGGPAAGGVRPADTARYALGDEIARGGMGVVYRATDTALGREVAVKVLREKYDTESGTARRFADEARIAAQLQHPGIPPVHDLGTLPDGRRFLAMKLIKGRTLEDMLRDRPDVAADRSRFVAVFEQICHAVAYAHAHSVVHRDLKPANVMVGAFGEVQVMDWGLAKVLGTGSAAVPGPDETAAGTQVVSIRDSDGSFTQAGSVLGTPAFMPPEQAVGAIGKVDARSDVFGLGAILAVILTGKPPFAAGSAETTRVKAAQGDVADCFARLDGCGAEPELVALCKRCLAPKPADRPGDAGAVAKAVAALRAAADDRARRAELEKVKVEGERAAAEMRAAEQRRRARLRLALAGAVGVLLLAGGGFAWYADRHAAAERDRQARTADAVAGLLDQAEAALRAGDAAKAGPLLDAAAARADDGGAESSAERFAALRADRGVLQDLDRVERYRFTPDGERRPDHAKVAARYRATLARFGADPDTAGAEAAAARVAGSAVRDRLVYTLDILLGFDPSTAVRTTLQALDPDAFRDALRDASLGRDRMRFAELAGRPDTADQPAGFVAFVVQFQAVPGDARKRLLTESLRRRPTDLVLLLIMTSLFPSQQSDVADERVRWCQAAVAAAPENPIAWSTLGWALAKRYELTRTGDIGEAIAYCREAVRLDPNYASAHNMLGYALVLTGDLDGAHAGYSEAIRLDPTDPTPRNDLAVLLLRKNDRDGAVGSYKQVVGRQPNNAWARMTLAQAMSRNGDLDGAVAELREVVRLLPKDADAHTKLAGALWAKNDSMAAIECYREAARLQPDHYLWHDWIAYLLLESGNGSRALGPATEAVRLNPSDAQSWHNLGRAKQAAGDYDGAVAGL